MINLIKKLSESGVVEDNTDNSNKEIEFGENLRKNGIVFLCSEFREDTITPIVAHILEYNLMPEQQSPKAISLIINSFGGHLHSAFHLIDAIKSSRLPVATFGFGTVASAGLFTLMAGAKGHRYVSENCKLMSHQWYGGASGKEHEMLAIAKDYEMTSNLVMNHYRKCTKKSQSYIKKNLLSPSDHFMTAQEAVNHGIADEVIKVY